MAAPATPQPGATAATLPAVGTKAVHKDDHAKSTGPVWEVVGVDPKKEKPIHINHARHKLNNGLEPASKQLTGEEFQSDFRQL